jgi:hypothetical protein
MTESLRKALLEQMGATAVTSELQALTNLVESEQRRSRRLLIWTLAVWGAWLALIAVSLGLPQIQKAMAPPRQAIPAATQPATSQATEADPTPANSAVSRPPPPSMLGAIVGSLFMAAVPGLPVIGIILLIRLIFSHRSASLAQIKASLAGIDAQLKHLAASQTRPPA